MDGEPRSLRTTVYLVAAVEVAMAAYELTRSTPFTIGVGILLLLASAGLLRRLRWGRRMSVVFMWLLLAFAVGDMLPARVEADEALGRVPATTGELVVRLAVLCGIALGALYYLGRQKERYRAGWW